MKSVLQKFDEMVLELKAHPEVIVFKCKKNPPVANKTLEKLKNKVSNLSQEIIDFYSECNGVFLELGLKSDIEDYVITPRAFCSFDYNTPPGRINLLKMEKVFSNAWMDTLYLEDDDVWKKMYGKKSIAPDALEESIFVLDYYSFYNLSAIIMGPTPFVIAATDHGADLDSSNWLTFSDYLKMTLSLYGLDRLEFALEGKSSKKKLIAWDKTYTLDEIIGKLKKAGH